MELTKDLLDRTAQAGFPSEKSNAGYSGTTIARQSRSQQDYVRQYLQRGYKVEIKRGTKKITLYRFLLAKSLFDPEGLALEQLATLWELCVQLDRQVEVDRRFAEKYSKWLFTTFEYLAFLSTSTILPIRIEGTHNKEWVKRLEPLLPSEHAYFGYRKDDRIVKSYRLRLRNPLDPPKHVRRRRLMGVGYRDKGHLRNPAKDGPHWKDHKGLWHEENLDLPTGIILNTGVIENTEPGISANPPPPSLGDLITKEKLKKESIFS